MPAFDRLFRISSKEDCIDALSFPDHYFLLFLASLTWIKRLRSGFCEPSPALQAVLGGGRSVGFDCGVRRFTFYGGESVSWLAAEKVSVTISR